MAVATCPSLVLVAEAPEICAPLVRVLLEEGFQVLQRAFSPHVKDLLSPANSSKPQQLLVLQPPLPADTRLVEALRRRDPSLPLLLLLLEPVDEEHRALLLDAGADDVLVHPFGVREFVARCRAILRRSRPPAVLAQESEPTDVLELGPIRLDRRQCRVALSGEEVSLTPREFRLLECFMQQPGRALSREQLIEQVWGPDYAGDSKSVDVHVLWLRRKLDRSGPRPQMFITVRGIGYRLDPPRG
jgi:two-component system, OmpR family, phosphate regulon response regulator PhoB